MKLVWDGQMRSPSSSRAQNRGPAEQHMVDEGPGLYLARRTHVHTYSVGASYQRTSRT